jgi:hypothetical protein
VASAGQSVSMESFDSKRTVCLLEIFCDAWLMLIGIKEALFDFAPWVK